MLQRKGKKKSVKKDFDTPFRRESTDQFNLTGWLIDNDLNDWSFYLKNS